MKRDLIKRLLAVAGEMNVEILGFGHGSKHPHIIFRCNGRILKHPFAGTSSDCRAMKNTIAQFRRRVRGLMQAHDHHNTIS